MRSKLDLLAQLLTENEVKSTGLPTGDFSATNVGNALRIFFGLVGAIAFIMVTLSGIKYVLSQGNPAETAKAKGTIIDAMIGLIICLSAVAIITFFMGYIR